MQEVLWGASRHALYSSTMQTLRCKAVLAASPFLLSPAAVQAPFLRLSACSAIYKPCTSKPGVCSVAPSHGASIRSSTKLLAMNDTSATSFAASAKRPQNTASIASDAAASVETTPHSWFWEAHEWMSAARRSLDGITSSCAGLLSVWGQALQWPAWWPFLASKLVATRSGVLGTSYR